MPNKVNIVETGEDADDADFYVCCRASVPARYDDDLFDFCCKCGEKVRHRPHGPTIPKKICYECIAPQMEKDAENGKLEISTTEKMAEEVRRFLRRS